MREINSASNPFVKTLRGLVESKKARQESGCFILEGWRGIDTLLSHANQHYQLETLVITPTWENDPRLPTKLDTVLLPDSLFDKISDVKNAQGILSIVRATPPPFEFYPDTGNYLLLDAIRDPGNLGTLIRSAVGAGFDGVLLYNECVDPFNPKVVRASMGTVACCNLWTVERSDIDQMRKVGYDLCVTAGVGGENLYETTFTPKTLLVVGSEANGVCDELMQLSTRKITIPLAKECESLNAAIAGSICMFQIRNYTYPFINQ